MGTRELRLCGSHCEYCTFTVPFGRVRHVVFTPQTRGPKIEADTVGHGLKGHTRLAWPGPRERLAGRHSLGCRPALPWLCPACHGALSSQP
eukprot:7388555-Prymnesium_polylepis.2